MIRLRVRLGAIAVAAILMLGVAGFAGIAPVAAAFVNGDEVVVFDGALNLRQDPGLSGLIILVLPDGAPLTVTGDPQNADAIDWYPVVTAAAENGFVAGQFIMAAPSGGDFQVGDDVYVFDGPLNLRNAAGTGAAILQTLATGTTAEILAGPTDANGTDWYQIAPQGAPNGWVAGDFLALSADPGGDFSAGDNITVFDGPLNLRNTPGLTGIILEILDTSTPAVIVDGPTSADGMDWYQIDSDLIPLGWVAGEFLALSGDPGGDFSPGDDIYVFDGPLNLRTSASLAGTILDVLPTGATGEVLAGPTSADSLDWYQIQVTGGEQGWVVGEFLALDDNGPVPAGDFEVGSFVFVNTDFLNLRATASINAAVLQTMSDGTLATVLSGPVSADGRTWYELAVGEGQNTDEGWAAGEYLVGGIKLGEDAVVADGPLNLREEATTSSTALVVLQTGDIVEVVSGPIIGGGYIWFGVDFNGTDGFVAGRYLGQVVV